MPCTGASDSILPRVMADHLGLQIGNALVLVDFHVLDIKLNWNSSLLLGRAFLSTVGAVCNLQSNQLCLTLIDPHTHYNPIPVKKPHASSRRINDPGIIASCHCGAEYETEYSASIETHTATSIDSTHQKLTDTPTEESVDSSPEDWENDYYNPTMAAYTKQNMYTEEYDEDYEEERPTEYKVILDEEDKLLHHSSWKKNAPSIDRTSSPSIDTQPHQRNRKRASTDIAYYPSIDTNIDTTRDEDYSIGSWADDRHHESYAVDTTYGDKGADELHEGFTYEELLNIQRRDETDQKRAEEAAWERTHFSHRSTELFLHRSTSILQHRSTSTIQHRSTAIQNQKPLHPSDSQRADNLFMQQRTITEHQQKVTKEFYDTAGGIDKCFKQRSRHTTRPSIDADIPTSVDRRPEFGRRAFDLFGTRKFYWEEKDEYGQGYARDVDGHTIRIHNKDIRRLLERASRDEHSYICLPEHASSFTQTKLVPEIYTNDEVNEMFYGIYGEQEKNKEDFQMKLDGVYYPLNDSISWLTTCMEEMRQDITRIQPSVDYNPPHSHAMKSQPDFHTRGEIDQLVEGIYRALETTEERLDRRCDDIYFPMDLSISALTSKIEAIQGYLVEIQSYIARRPEASASLGRSNNISTDIRR
ncbi:hypothetical protein F2Q70_00038543 [Brassica cretica]|uniref:Uncharacterized protein n=1 Tax=Brassica cretica TaxID=69181 RepID=A0A8S9K7K0_BRACR|nr:hypothetical protein F2Q70_00038543 [Brassica cretica]